LKINFWRIKLFYYMTLVCVFTTETSCTSVVSDSSAFSHNLHCQLDGRRNVEDIEREVFPTSRANDEAPVVAGNG